MHLFEINILIFEVSHPLLQELYSFVEMHLDKHSLKVKWVNNIVSLYS
jgi:hypothetical protein